MVTLSSTLRYYLWLEAVDMRKSFDGLQGIVTNEMKRRALSGEVFIFMNRRRDQVKLLVWSDLILILEGVSLRSVRWRKRFSLENRAG